jgi:hypothetical protein
MLRVQRLITNPNQTDLRMRVVFGWLVVVIAICTTANFAKADDPAIEAARANPVPLVATDGVLLQVRTPNNELIVNEPLFVQFVWKNTNRLDAVTVHDFLPSSAVLEKDGVPKQVKLFQTSREQTEDFASPNIVLQPGEKYRQPYRALVLSMDDNGQNPEFLFSSPGKYNISFSERKDCRVTFAVKAPELQQDVLAERSFTISMAQMLLGEEFGAAQGGRVQKEMMESLQKHPSSYLSGYFSLGLADYQRKLTPSPFNIDEGEYVGLLQNALAMDAGHFVREMALFRKSHLAFYQKDGRPRALEIASLLASEIPDSMYLKLLKEMNGGTLDHVAEVNKRIIFPKATLVGHSFDLIGDIDVRDAFEDYWTAFCTSDQERIRPLLHDSYHGSDGSKSNRVNRIPSRISNNVFDKIQITVLKSESVKQVKPLYLSSDGWSGTIQIIEFELGGIISANAAEPELKSRVRTVMIKEEDSWLVASDEFMKPNLNANASRLAQQFMLKATIDIDKLQLVKDDHVQQFSDILIDKLDEPKAVIVDIKILSMMMEGAEFDRPVFAGEVSSRLRGKDRSYSFVLKSSSPLKGNVLEFGHLEITLK